MGTFSTIENGIPKIFEKSFFLIFEAKSDQKELILAPFWPKNEIKKQVGKQEEKNEEKGGNGAKVFHRIS